MPKFQRLKITRLFQATSERLPSFYDRIAEFQRTGRNLIIIIDGKPRTGKSYFAKWLIKQYVKEYITVFTLEELIKELEKGITNRWILFDEVELQAPATEFRSTGNLVIRSMVASYGYLNNNLIMTTPSIAMMDKSLRSLISFRITMSSRFTKGKTKYTAWIKKPIYNENKAKWFWVVVEEHHVCDIPVDDEYEKKKAFNFVSALELWKKKLAVSDAKSDMTTTRTELQRVKLDSAKLRLAKQQQNAEDERRKNITTLPT